MTNYETKQNKKQKEQGPHRTDAKSEMFGDLSAPGAGRTRNLHVCTKQKQPTRLPTLATDRGDHPPSTALLKPFPIHHLPLIPNT